MSKLNLFKKNAHGRGGPAGRKSPDATFPVRVRALLRNRSGWGIFALVWLAAWVFSLAGADRGARLPAVGQPAPAEITAAVDFDVPDSPGEAADPDRKPTKPESRRAIRAGTVLVEQGRLITEKDLNLLRLNDKAIRSQIPMAGRIAGAGGNAVLLFTGWIGCAGILWLLQPGIFKDRPALLLFLVVSSVTLALCKWSVVSLLIRDSLPAYAPYLMMPVALAPMLAAILSGRVPALAAGFWTSFAASVYAHYRMEVFAAGFAATALLLLAAGRFRTRRRIMGGGLWIGGVSALCTVGAALVHGAPAIAILQYAAISLASGFVVALITLVLLPLLELGFGITTDISLLELCDMQHPLLKRLAIEAPGTYHHSLMLANLAEAAADVVGANTLLVRVSAYFHDIGKLVKPGFFIENIQLADNPHDHLTPSMSTIVITAHVKEGLDLARSHKLPKPVIDAILQHHGTGMVSYFYHKASHQQELNFSGEARVRQDQFRYPGPKPRTRETAILCIADAVEAASRSLEKTSPRHVENMVNEIVAARIEDGQLDACPLTLAELTSVRKALIFTLVNMLHARLPYPADETKSQ